MRAEGAKTLTEGMRNRAGEIDLPIESHQHSDSLHAAVVLRYRSAFMHKFVGQIFNGVAQNLQSMSGLGREHMPPMGT